MFTKAYRKELVSFVKEKYSKAETSRRMDEERWVQAYRNYRGLYGPDVQFTSTEKSKIFVKVTKTKVLAAYGQIAEVLFGGNKFPITIDPTVLPDNVEETVNFEKLIESIRVSFQYFEGQFKFPKLEKLIVITNYPGTVSIIGPIRGIFVYIYLVRDYDWEGRLGQFFVCAKFTRQVNV